MHKYQRIIAAVDFSTHAPYVAKHAVTLARQLSSELVFLNVINQREIDAIFETIGRLEKNASVVGQRCVDQLREERETKADELRSLLNLDGIQHRFIVRSGVPFQELIKSINEEMADMMIVGVKGRSDLADVMVGSTTQKMFKRCPVPLLVVRKEDQA